MYVRDQQLPELIKAIRNPCSDPQQKHIVTSLCHYDSIIQKAITFRSKIEFDMQRESIQASHFESCHSLITQNLQLQGTITDLQGKLVEYAKDRAQLQTEKQKSQVLRKQIERVKEYDAYFEVAHDVLSRIQDSMEIDAGQHNKQEPGETIGDIVIRQQTERLALIERGLEIREKTCQDKQLVSQEIIVSLQSKVRALEDTIEGLNRELAKKEKQKKKQSPQSLPLKIADRQLIKRYQLEITTMLEAEKQFQSEKKQMEGEIQKLKEQKRSIITEDELLKLEIVQLKSKVEALQNEKKVEAKAAYKQEFAIQEAQVKQKGHQFIESDKTIRILKKEVSELQLRNQSLTKEYEQKLHKLSAELDTMKKKYIHQSQELAVAQTKLNTDWKEHESKFEQFKKSCQLQIQKLSEVQNDVMAKDRKISDIRKQAQDADAKYRIQSQQLKQAHRVIDTHSATISKLRKEIEQQLHTIEQLQRQPHGSDADYGKVLLEMNHIINLITLT